ncbi:hypothetical protein GGR38_002452 [Novosphingobium sediminicola]|uniref:Uncharacterized protein n=1 Tax=Novosphingobium sediminicola TaxID=563162 RepID=A0A7W6G6N1_9SPHN|nr:hypothetical protein [Novosphingobium sediminicola]
MSATAPLLRIPGNCPVAFRTETRPDGGKDRGRPHHGEGGKPVPFPPLASLLSRLPTHGRTRAAKGRAKRRDRPVCLRFASAMPRSKIVQKPGPAGPEDEAGPMTHLHNDVQEPGPIRSRHVWSKTRLQSSVAVPPRHIRMRSIAGHDAQDSINKHAKMQELREDLRERAASVTIHSFPTPPELSSSFCHHFGCVSS